MEENQLNPEEDNKTSGMAEAAGAHALESSSLASENFEEDAEFFDDVDSWGNMIISSK